MKTPKILFVIPWLPYPLKSGGNQALFNGINAIKYDFDIYIAYEAIDDENHEESKAGFLKLIPNAHLLPLLNKDYTSLKKLPLWYRIASKLKNKIRNMIMKDEPDGKIECNKENVICNSWFRSISITKESWINHISNLCSQFDFDIIQVEMPLFLSMILSLPQKPKKIYVHHELGFVRRELEQRKLGDNEYIKACKDYANLVEIGLLNRYDAIVTLSSIDMEKLINHGVKVPVFSSFAVVESSKGKWSHTTDGRHLSFVGPDFHDPNYEGVKWFLENCWTLLKNYDNQYKLSIIGQWSQKHIDEITSKYPNVDFLGFVDKLENGIKNTIMIVPLTIGSGIRMKILEACSLGIPFVSTSIGAEGIPVQDGVSCFIADTPEMFVKKLLLLQNKDTQRTFVDNANKLVLDKYSLASLRNNRLNIYRMMIDRENTIE